MLYWIISFLLPISAIAAMVIPFTFKSSSKSAFEQSGYYLLMSPFLVAGSFGMTKIVFDFLVSRGEISEALWTYLTIWGVNFFLFLLPVLIILILRQKLSTQVSQS